MSARYLEVCAIRTSRRDSFVSLESTATDINRDAGRIVCRTLGNRIFSLKWLLLVTGAKRFRWKYYGDAP
jgi:hypothetical protein